MQAKRQAEDEMKDDWWENANCLFSDYEKEEKKASPFSEVLCGAEVLADRREMLCKKPPTCPDCKTDQVQLTEWIEGEVAEWKCRHCRTRFKFERVA